MKFPSLKFMRNSGPSLKSLRPNIFNVNLFWFVGLGLFIVLFVVAAFVGSKLFLFEYFESYKNNSKETSEDIINTDRLKSAIEKRNSVINEKTPLPRDPSL